MGNDAGVSCLLSSGRPAPPTERWDTVMHVCGSLPTTTPFLLSVSTKTAPVAPWILRCHFSEISSLGLLAVRGYHLPLLLGPVMLPLRDPALADVGFLN